MKRQLMRIAIAAIIALSLSLALAAGALGEEYTDMDTVLAVQKALNAEGYDSGKEDGLIGSKTISAITSCQRSEGIEVTGTITDELLEVLGLKESAEAPAEESVSPSENPSITSGKNMLLNALDPNYVLYKGATATITHDVAVEEWETEEAIQVQGKGGEQKIVLILLNKPNTNLPIGDYTLSVYVKNDGATPIKVGRGKYGTTIAPGEAKRATVTFNVSSDLYLQIQFVTSEVGEEFNFTFWHPMVERGSVATDWTEEADIQVRLENLEAQLAAYQAQ